MKHSFKIFLASIIYIFIGINGYSQTIPEPMNPPRLVNDFADIFSTEQQNSLEQILRAYNDSTSTQIYVVTVKDLEGYAVSDYAVRLGEKWKIGQKSKDNGAVMLIKPKIGSQRGQVFIATGYGLEAKLNDARVGRIIDYDMLPYFRENNYYGGTKTGIETMIGYLSGEFKADEQEDEPSWGEAIGLVIIVFLVVFIITRKNNKGNRGNRSRGGGFFPPIIGGGRGGSRSGGGGFGSFGGGGGGRFGGGGAGRGW